MNRLLLAKLRIEAEQPDRRRTEIVRFPARESRTGIVCGTTPGPFIFVLILGVAFAGTSHLWESNPRPVDYESTALAN
jgi:hypothetical protein